MNRIKITKEMLEGKGSKILATGLTTDEQINYYGWGDSKKPLKFVVCKGFINDWCIYLESMSEVQSFEIVKGYGNKINSDDKIKYLIECSEEVLERYRK